MVLVVGNHELFEEVSGKLKPNKNQPVVKHIPLEKAQNLKHEWAYDAKKIDKKIHKYIDDKKSFVFYRHNPYSNACEDADDAVFEICAIFKEAFLLVVGNDEYIEDEIQNDIQIVAHFARLENENYISLIKDLENPDFKSRFIGGAVFTLLVLPNVDQLKKALEEELNLPIRNLKIIYSGHSPSDGSWYLGDALFYASNLKEMLKSIPQRYNPKIHIYLNACYGLAFAKDIADINVLRSVFDMVIKDEEEMKPFFEIRTAQEIMEYAGDSKHVESDSNYLNSYHMNLNKCITKMMIKIWRKVPNLEPLNKLNGVFVLPFAFGPLDGAGILPDLFKTITEKYDLPKLRGATEKLDDRLNGEGIADDRPKDPQLIVFPAARGDSTLFRWHNFNMLVDGGLIKRPPCFWETVRRLPNDQKLDIVVVTHYDSDHIAGILRLFEEKENGSLHLPIDIGELYTMIPSIENPSGTRSIDQGSKLVKNAKNLLASSNVKNLETNCQNAICKKTFDNNDRLCIYMLTPTKENLPKECKPIMRSRLTPPNIGSASLLIECYKGSSNECQRALLTGDAPPKAILQGLHTLRKNDKLNSTTQGNCYCYLFDYVDMPHHGAYGYSEKNSTDQCCCEDFDYTNDPDLFLSHIQTRACVVSTDGKRYGHPQDESLEILKSHLEANTIRKLFFTYRKDPDRDISLKLEGQNTKCVFACNDPSSTSQHCCFLFNLSLHKAWKCKISKIAEEGIEYDY